MLVMFRSLLLLESDMLRKLLSWTLPFWYLACGLWLGSVGCNSESWLVACCLLLAAVSMELLSGLVVFCLIINDYKA